MRRLELFCDIQSSLSSNTVAAFLIKRDYEYTFVRTGTDVVNKHAWELYFYCVCMCEDLCTEVKFRKKIQNPLAYGHMCSELLMIHWA